MAVADTKVPLFKDPFWHFQIKIKFWKKIMRQGSIRLPDADFFWIIPCQYIQEFNPHLFIVTVCMVMVYKFAV